MAVFIVLMLLLLGAVAGFVMHRSDFCLAGMFRDLVLFRSTIMLRNLLLLMVTALLLFEVARLSGWVRVPFPLLAPPSWVNLLGGLLFGIGMVLAGGCVVGTLYKLGAGSLPSLFALIGLLGGSALYAEVHPGWSALAARGRLTEQVTVPQLLGLSPTPLIVGLALPAVLLLWRWQRQGRLHRESFAEGYLQPWQAALLLAAVGLGSALLVGMPFGITTAYAKLAGFLEQWLWPEHLAQLSYFAAETLHFDHPRFDLSLHGGAGPRWDGIALAQFPVIAGILLGAAFSALRLGEWRISAKAPPRQYLWALFGGIVMGLASRMAPGCNVWHLFGGLPVLAGQSLLFVAGLFPGAWLGSRLLVRFVI